MYQESSDIITSYICSGNQEPPPILNKKTQAYLPEPYQRPPIFPSKHMNNNIALDLNISSYYINHLSSPDI